MKNKIKNRNPLLTIFIGPTEEMKKNKNAQIINIAGLKLNLNNLWIRAILRIVILLLVSGMIFLLEILFIHEGTYLPVGILLLALLLTFRFLIMGFVALIHHGTLKIFKQNK